MFFSDSKPFQVSCLCFVLLSLFRNPKTRRALFQKDYQYLSWKPSRSSRWSGNVGFQFWQAQLVASGLAAVKGLERFFSLQKLVKAGSNGLFQKPSLMNPRPNQPRILLNSWSSHSSRVAAKSPLERLRGRRCSRRPSQLFGKNVVFIA